MGKGIQGVYMNKLEELYDKYCALEDKKNVDGNSKEALEAVKQNGYALAYISNPSEQVCLEAVKQREGALQYTPSHMFDSMISSLPDSLKLLSSSKVIRELAEKSLKKKI